MNETITSLSRFLLENDNFVLIIHANPDGDCFGSACGLCGALTKLNKKCTILSPNAIPKRLEFLNYSGIAVLAGKEGYESIKNQKCTYITVDVASDQLLPEIVEEVKEKISYAVDHHTNNTVTAKRLYLDSIASAVGEIVYSIIAELEEWSNETLFDSKIASSVFGAISSDTGCFKYSNVTPDTHRIAAKLIEKGADSADINYRLFDLKSPKQIACEGFAYGNIELFEDGKISFIYISDDILAKIGASQSDTETISQIGRGIEGVQIAVFMRDKGEGAFKISVRSNNDADMAELCATFGGGGHKKAAGCTIHANSSEKAKEMFLKKAKIYLEQKRA